MGVSVSRDQAADVWRALAIVGVVFIHVADHTFSGSIKPLLTGCFRWAVPVFLMLTAYFVALSVQRSPEVRLWPFLTQRYAKLWPPFVAYSALYALLTVDWQHLTAITLLTKHFSGYGWAGQYFFILLFQLLPVAYWLARRPLSARGVVGITVLTLGVYSLVWHCLRDHAVWTKIGERPIIYWLPYAAWGVYLAQTRPGWMPWLQQRLHPAAGVMALLILPWLASWGAQPAGSLSAYLAPSVLLTSMLMLPLGLVLFQGLHAPLISYAGRHSMVIFCLNPLWTFVWQRLGLFSRLPDDGHVDVLLWRTLASVIAVAATMFMCLLTGEVFKRVGLKALVM